MGSKKKASKAKRTGAKKPVKKSAAKKLPKRTKPEPAKKKISTAPEPRAAAPPVAQDHVEGVSEEQFDEEIESIGDGTDDTEPLGEDEVDEDDDEGYF